MLALESWLPTGRQCSEDLKTTASGRRCPIAGCAMHETPKRTRAGSGVGVGARIEVFQ